MAAAAAGVSIEAFDLKKTTCLIADDHPAIVETVKTLLERRGLTVERCAANGTAACMLIEELHPELALLDVHMPGMNGIEVARAVRQSSPETKVLMYTAHADSSFLNDALDAGVLGFIGKDTPLPELMRAIGEVVNGRVYIDPVLASMLVFDKNRNTEPLLTERERDVLRGIAAGHDQETIAKQLYLSPTTVRTHLTKAMRKLGAANRTQAVVKAIALKLIRPPEV